MALNDGLARFKLQQERNQAALSAIAAAKTSSSSSSTRPSPSQQQPGAAPTPRPAAKPSPPVPAVRISDDTARLKETNTARKLAAGAQIRFSDDTARLQKINEVRRSPVGKQIRDVIALLERTREALTAHQINEKTYVDIDGAIAERLRNNPKVRFDGERYSYKRTHDVRGKDELLSLVGSFPDGLPASEVEDAYPSVLEDLQALKSSGDIFLLPVERDMIAYPDDPRSRMEVDAELKKMFHDIKLPVNMVDVEKELRKNGEKPATDTAKRRAAEQIHGRQPEPEKARKKPRGITSRTKLTNAHLPGLFDLPVDNKDSKDFI
ncbi:hypothetical protein CFC21_039016 [Triticum aestivum]|uniref:TFIIE beta domain-containing protein n=2 Tax=Triticum aestivum TaxID=4565 RepID=A0A9R1FDY1_WHEAT|nr:hypothetical protein CFC21_039016 [Triticum aestivum]